jgi:hypothetical protein
VNGSRLAGNHPLASTTRRTPRTAASTGLTPQQLAVAKRMPEDKGRNSLLVNVIDACHVHRLTVAHFRHARVGERWVTAVQGDGVGYPDLTIVGPCGVVWRELKSWAGQLSPEQREWLDVLAAAGADVGVWTPLEWFDGTVCRELAAVAGKGSA